MSDEQGKDRRPFGFGERRDAERVLSMELLSAFRAHAVASTEFAARLSGQIINNILLVRTQAFPAEGYIAHEFGAAAGYITVTPADNSEVTVSSGGPSPDGLAPTNGTGVHIVPSGSHGKTIPLASHVCTIYGTPGDRVSYIIGTAVPGPVLS